MLIESISLLCYMVLNQYLKIFRFLVNIFEKHSSHEIILM